jgi:hypothetical protein
MEEQNSIILGIYIMGLRKRPELAHKPCVITYSNENKKIDLAITYDDKVEKISFDISRIVGAKNVVRTIMSQSDFKDSSPNEQSVTLLTTAISGVYGTMFATLLNSSKLLSNSNSGEVNYTSLNELQITYINDEGQDRDLLIQTDLDPTKFIELINNQISSINS